MVAHERAPFGATRSDGAAHGEHVEHRRRLECALQFDEMCAGGVDASGELAAEGGKFVDAGVEMIEKFPEVARY